MHELNEDILDKEIRLIGAEGQQLGIMSSQEALKIAGIEINRKMLSEMAISNPAAFTQLIEIAKKA